MTPDREALVKRIQKLMALAMKNPHPHEAEAAMAKAQALMAEYKVTELELANFVERQTEARIAQRPPRWQAYLGREVCVAYGVMRMIDRATDGRTVYTFSGEEFRVQIAVYAFNVLARQARGATRRFMAGSKKRKGSTRSKEAEEYALGFVLTACDLLAKIAPPSEAERAALAKFVARHDLVTVKSKAARIGAAGLKGMAAGDDAQLYHGTGGAPAPGQVGGGQLQLEAAR